MRFTSTSLGADAIRYVIAGGLNTFLTLLIYQAILYAMPHLPAYAIAWTAGTAFIIIVYPFHVFPEGRTSLVDRALLGATYLGVFLFGLALLHVLTLAGLPSRLGILVVIIATTTVNFLVARFLLRR